MSHNNKWDLRFLNLAELVSTWSKDPSTKVGAVIVNDKKEIISLGYNGLPSKIPDVQAILQNREEKYKYILHAETNAILTARTNVTDCVLYTYPFLPCTNCASMIIQAGIKCVVSVECIDERWKNRIDDSKYLFSLADIPYIEITRGHYDNKNYV